MQPISRMRSSRATHLFAVDVEIDQWRCGGARKCEPGEPPGGGGRGGTPCVPLRSLLSGQVERQAGSGQEAAMRPRSSAASPTDRHRKYVSTSRHREMSSRAAVRPSSPALSGTAGLPPRPRLPAAPIRPPPSWVTGASSQRAMPHARADRHQPGVHRFGHASRQDRIAWFARKFPREASEISGWDRCPEGLVIPAVTR